MSEAVHKGAKGALLKAALLFSSVDGMVASALMVPLLGSIAAEYPDAAPGLLNQTLSLPSLLMIPAIIITGYLSKYISKKYLLMLGSIIFVVSGFGSMYSPSLEALVAFRACEGIGMGIVYPLAPAIIAHLFYGEERAKLIGWTNACGGIFSFVLGIGAGYAALTDWRHAFYYYLIFIIVVVMQGILLPAFPPEKKDETIIQAATSGEKPKLGYAVYLTIGAMLIFMSVAMVIIYNLAIFIMSEGIGTSADAGMASSINTVASFFISLGFGYIFRFLKRYISVLGLFFMACSYFILSSAHTMSLVYAGTICLGASMGCIFPYLMTRVAQVAPKAVKTMAVTWLSMSIYLGQWLSGYFAVWMANMVGGTTRQLFSAVGMIFLVFAVLAAVFIAVTQKYESKVVVIEQKIELDDVAYKVP
ncbi:MFS transporter [Dehalobacter sp. DCM]|uniref:MFS transporter n=1 Tax=Dehalobacter sp. DCM TaxID=2907827 RepID=UPI003081A55D|nr:MFS transporter [Dehalobacter sp. DCM]